MSEKPQTFDEWWGAWTEQAIDWESPYSISKKAYNAGQASIEPAVSLLAEIVTSYDAALAANQMPWTRLDLIQAIDRAGELLKGEKF